MRRVSLNRSTFSNILKKLNDTLMEVSVPKISTLTEAELILDGDHCSYVDGEPVKKSLYNLEEVWLPISKVIDIYHNGYSVYVSNSERLVAIAKAVSDTLDDLESLHNRTDEVDDVIEYIEEFYTEVLKRSRTKLNKLDNTLQENKVLGLNESLVGGYNEKAGNVNISRINIDDITV